MKRSMSRTTNWAAALAPAALFTTAGLAEATQDFPACDAEFEITEPKPRQLWTPSAITLVSEEIADGVFAVVDSRAEAGAPAGYPLATSGGFVIGDEEVVMVETMWNRQLFCQVVDLIRAETDLPVRYAVNTNYHADHMFGNGFLPDDVMVVQHVNTAEKLGEDLTREIAASEQGFGTDQGFDEVTPRLADIVVDADGWSVDLGRYTFEARDYGFAQTGGDLYFYVPEAKVMWTGNSLTAEEPAVPWLLAGGAEDVSETLKAVQASLPEDAIVVPGHGRPVGRDGFTFAIDYLDALVASVKSSVAAGLNLEQASAAASLEAFQGYAGWGFAHTRVNVPNTYKDLSTN